MSPLVRRLVDRAFSAAPTTEANQAIAAAREARGSEVSEAMSYEVVLPALGPDEYLKDKVLPRLVYWLDSRGVKLPGTRGMFVSLFTPAGLFFIDSGDVVSALAEAKGLELAEVKRRYGLDGSGDPRLLGG